MSKRPNRQALYLILFSLLLLGGVVVFSLFFLIPKGKEYRTMRLESKKEEQLIALAKERLAQEEVKFSKLSKEHIATLKAFKTAFNPKQFTQENRQAFHDLYLSELEMAEHNRSFKIYEVNATTKITSPQIFYEFLEKINHSPWIIAVNFPIHFQREGEWIKSSFTMQVYTSDHEKSEDKQKEAEPLAH